MTEKMTQDDIYRMFGGTLPVAAMVLIQNNAPDLKIRLEGMAELWKSMRKSLIRPANMHPFTYGGRVVGIEHEPLCLLETDKMAEEMTMLLNMGHERFLQEVKS
jgi:hypothetical protein